MSELLKTQNMKLLMLLESAQNRLRKPPKEIRGVGFRELMDEIFEALQEGNK